MTQESVPSYISKRSSFIEELRKNVDEAEGPVLEEWRQHYGAIDRLDPKEAVSTSEKMYQTRIVPKSTPFTWKTKFPILPGMDNPMSRFLKEIASRDIDNEATPVGSEAWQEVKRTLIPCLHDQVFLLRMLEVRRESENAKENYQKNVLDSDISREEKRRFWEEAQQAANGSHASEKNLIREVACANDTRLDGAWSQWVKQNPDKSACISHVLAPDADVLASVVEEPCPESVASFNKRFATYAPAETSDEYMENEQRVMASTHLLISNLQHAWKGSSDSDTEESSGATDGQKTEQSQASISPVLALSTMYSSDRKSQS